MIHSDKLKYNKMQMNKTDSMDSLASPVYLERLKVPEQIVRACVNLYGIVDCDFLIHQIVQLPEANGLMLHDYIALIDSLVQQDDNLQQQGPWLYSQIVCPSSESLSSLLEEKMCLPYWESSLESLLPYADDEYFEQTKELETLMAFLSDRGADADRLIRFIGLRMRHATTDDVLAQMLTVTDCSCLDMNKLRSLILEAEYVTRKVCLRGHTLQEEKALCDDWQSRNIFLT